VWNFDRPGVQREKTWQCCISVPLQLSMASSVFDDALDAFSAAHEACNKYHETRNNCFDYAVAFFNSIDYRGRSNHTRSSVCDDLPGPVSAALNLTEAASWNGGVQLRGGGGAPGGWGVPEPAECSSCQRKRRKLDGASGGFHHTVESSEEIYMEAMQDVERRLGLVCGSGSLTAAERILKQAACAADLCGRLRGRGGAQGGWGNPPCRSCQRKKRQLAGSGQAAKGSGGGWGHTALVGSSSSRPAVASVLHARCGGGWGQRSCRWDAVIGGGGGWGERPARKLVEEWRSTSAEALAQLREVAAAVQCDPQVVSQAVQLCSRALLYAASELGDDLSFVLAVVRQDMAWSGHAAMAIRRASQSLQDHFAVIVLAVMASGRALQYAPDVVRANPAVVLIAVDNQGDALQWAAPACQAAKV
jgi:hypothetical protein